MFQRYDEKELGTIPRTLVETASELLRCTVCVVAFPGVEHLIRTIDGLKLPEYIRLSSRKDGGCFQLSVESFVLKAGRHQRRTLCDLYEVVCHMIWDDLGHFLLPRRVVHDTGLGNRFCLRHCEVTEFADLDSGDIVREGLQV